MKILLMLFPGGTRVKREKLQRVYGLGWVTSALLKTLRASTKAATTLNF